MAVPTPSSCSSPRYVSVDDNIRCCVPATYLADPLAQEPCLGDHAIVVRCVVEGPAEGGGVHFLDADADAEVLNAGAEEELVAEERLDDRGDAGSKTGAGGPGAAVVGGRVNLSEKPVVWR